MQEQKPTTDSPSQDADPRPVPPPTQRATDASDERKPSMFLILGLNVVLLALAIWYVAYKLNNPSSGDATASTGDGTAETGTTDGTGSTGQGRPGEGIAPPPPRTEGNPFVNVPAPGGGNGMSSVFDGEDVLSAPGNPAAGQPRTKRDTHPELSRFTPSERRAIMATDEALQRLGLDLEILVAIHGDYPTSKIDYGTNRGIEHLTEKLQAARRLDLGGLETGDTDGDGREEILDPWGSPLVYFSHDDYPNPQTLAIGGTTVEFAAALRPDRGFRAERRFQLWSVGLDQRNGFGTGQSDDITSWGINDF